MNDRVVVCVATIQFARTIPEDYTLEELDFLLNDSSSCANNIYEDIRRGMRDGHCLCDLCEAHYLREATQEDLERFGYQRRPK